MKREDGNSGFLIPFTSTQKLVSILFFILILFSCKEKSKPRNYTGGHAHMEIMVQEESFFGKDTFSKLPPQGMTKTESIALLLVSDTILSRVISKTKWQGDVFSARENIRVHEVENATEILKIEFYHDHEKAALNFLDTLYNEAYLFVRGYLGSDVKEKLLDIESNLDKIRIDINKEEELLMKEKEKNPEKWQEYNYNTRLAEKMIKLMANKNILEEMIHSLKRNDGIVKISVLSNGIMDNDEYFHSTAGNIYELELKREELLMAKAKNAEIKELESRIREEKQKLIRYLELTIENLNKEMERDMELTEFQWQKDSVISTVVLSRQRLDSLNTGYIRLLEKQATYRMAQAGLIPQIFIVERPAYSSK
ncbi:MAG: hypothetical protein ACOZCO_10750 [Bacteroidota bacterium]